MKDQREILNMLKNRYVANIALISGIIITILLAFSYSFNKLALTWQNSNTYGHGFLILPIVLWLVNQKKHLLTTVAVKPSIFALLLVGLTSLLWFISVLTYINVVEQLVLFSLFIVLTWAFFGWRVVLALKFPLAFLYFSIPVGDFLIPYLQFITADISVYLIKVLGIPVYRDGMYIQIPNGNFLVAEACSGIRFLISTITIGVLYSYLHFTKLYKRIVFILLCFAVAIIGNGLRAFLMILIGHLSDMKAAVGFDHIVYGWVFFSIIIGILFVIGYFMSDPEETVKPNDKNFNTKNKQRFPSVFFIVITLLLLLLGPVLKYKYDGYLTQLTAQHEKPDINGSHDSRVTESWLPKFPDADEVYFSKSTGDSQADFYTAKYFFENDRKEVISYKNSLFDLDKWSLKTLTSKEFTNEEHESIPYKAYTIVQMNGTERQLRVIYKVGNSLAANKIHFKLLQLFNKITMVDFGGEVIVISSNDKRNAGVILDQYMSQHFRNIQHAHK
jgi:exosortase A